MSWLLGEDTQIYKPNTLLNLNNDLYQKYQYHHGYRENKKATEKGQVLLFF